MHSLSTHCTRWGIFSHSRMHSLNTHYTRRDIFNHSSMHSLKTLITPVGTFNHSSLQFSKRSLWPLCIPFEGFVSHSPIFSIGFSFCSHSPTITIGCITNSQASVECCASSVKIIMSFYIIINIFNQSKEK